MKKLDRYSRYIMPCLLCVVIVLGIVYSLVQPLGLSPDEAAHMKYVRFLASHGHLPVWKLDGGGEAGYESQHPPLYYALGAVVYRVTAGLPENWQWQAVRWYTLLIGIILMCVSWSFFREYFRGRLPDTIFAFAALGTTPLLLEYMTYINPDIMSVLWCSIILWMCMRIARGEATRKDRIILSLALGFGLLTKLTVLGTLPLIIVAHLIEPHPESKLPWERRRLLFMGTMLGAAAMAAFWYIRNSILYRTPFIHTEGRFGSGLDIVQAVGMGPHFLWVTLSNTYLTIWVERAWLPPQLLGRVFYLLISILIIVALLGSVYRAICGSKRLANIDRAPLLCGILLLSLIISHQAQVWLVDYEFNAGGRYLLNGILAIQAMIVGSFSQMRFNKIWNILWIVVLIAINIVSIQYMISTLNPSNIPEWELMKLTVPYK